ncbi:MAG: 50S ribosomal protein L30 [Chloroflexi bacterium]|nr:50S ribosomal protein L30 [Chloroflexota bacterium]
MQIRISWTKSDIGYSKRQKDTIAAMGLRRLNQSVVLEDSPAVRGMVAKVRHLVSVEPVPAGVGQEESEE